MQQRNEKVAEPSMEDILASIRKIISEEPTPTKAGPAAGAVPAAAPSPPVAPPRPVTSEGLRPAMPTAPATPAAAQPTSRLSDFVRELAPTAVPVGAPSTTSFQDDMDDLVEPDADEAPPAAPMPAARMPAPTAPAAAVEPQRASAPAPVHRPADLGAFIPSSAQSIGMSSPRPQALSIGPDLRAFDLLKPVMRDFPEPMSPAQRPLELGVPAAVADHKPVVEETRQAAEPAEVLSADVESASVEAAQKALGALAMGLATPSPATGAPVASAMVPSAPAAVFGDRADAVPTRRSLDDTIVDMLRPMIGDWLDEHLPEMVEKALRQELGDRGKSGR